MHVWLFAGARHLLSCRRQSRLGRAAHEGVKDIASLTAIPIARGLDTTAERGVLREGGLCPFFWRADGQSVLGRFDYKDLQWVIAGGCVHADAKHELAHPDKVSATRNLSLRFDALVALRNHKR